jgi:hypothetical protein
MQFDHGEHQHIESNMMPPFAARHDQNLALRTRSAAVLVRFGLRTIVVVLFAAFATIGFQQGLTVLLWMSAVLSGMLATLHREEPFEATLNHWDEGLAYAALCSLACALGYPSF